MAKNAKWSDDYWLLLMQIYLQKPVGIKPTFKAQRRRDYINPQIGPNCHRFSYGFADAFYEGVEVQETFERDFKPVNKETTMTPVMMTLILDLYFRLTPVTMVPETPEVQELAKLIKVRPQEVIEIMKLFQYCDPYLNRKDQPDSTLLAPCQEIWRRYGNAETEQLAAYAEQLKEYFRS